MLYFTSYVYFLPWMIHALLYLLDVLFYMVIIHLRGMNYRVSCTVHVCIPARLGFKFSVPRTSQHRISRPVICPSFHSYSHRRAPTGYPAVFISQRRHGRPIFFFFRAAQRGDDVGSLRSEVIYYDVPPEDEDLTTTAGNAG